MKFLYPRGCGRYPLKVVFDEFEYDSEMERFCRWLLRKQLERPLDITVIPKKFDPNELYAMHNSIFGMTTCHTIYD